MYDHLSVCQVQLNLFCVRIWKLDLISYLIAMIGRWIYTWHSQKHILCSDFLTIKSLKLRPLTRIFFQNRKLCDLLLAPDFMLFTNFLFFIFLGNWLLHFILLFINALWNIFLSNFSFYFSERLCNLFIFIVSRSTDGTWIKHTSLEWILNHFHFLLFSTN